MGGRYVGIDLHRRRSVIYTMDSDGERLDCVRIVERSVGVARAGCEGRPGRGGGDRSNLRLVLGGRSAPRRRVQRHLSHPSGNDWGNRRVKNDEHNARDLAEPPRV